MQRLFSNQKPLLCLYSFWLFHFGCVGQDLSVDKRTPLSPNETSPNPLPSDEQQRTNGHAVAPAVAGRAPHKSSAALSRMNSVFRVYWQCSFFLLFQLVSASY